MLNLRTPLVVLIVLAVLPIDSAGADDTGSASGILTLVNGDTFAGRLCASDSADLIRWHSDDFLEPFTFEVGAIKSVRFSTESKHKPAGQFIVQCADGDVIAGNIRYWDQNRVLIESESLGLLDMQPNAITNIHRIESRGHSLVSFGTPLNDWNKTEWSTAGWFEEGEVLVADQVGAALNRDFDLPPRAVIDLELGWSAAADFVVAIGTNPDAASDTGIDGWRLETVQKQLAIVREGKDHAYLKRVADLSDRVGIRLIAYLDQPAGKMHLFSSDGQFVGKLSSQTSANVGRGIRIINRGTKLKLLRLRVSPWLGTLPDADSKAGMQINLTDGSSVLETIDRFDPDSDGLILGTGEDARKVKLAKVVSAHFATESNHGGQPQAVLRLCGGVQISGSIAAVDAKSWKIADSKFREPIRVPQDQVRGLVITEGHQDQPQRDLRIGKELDGHRIGRFESRGRTHLGWVTGSRLEPADKVVEEAPKPASLEPGLSAIHWQPVASRSASRLQPDLAGRIVYETNHRLVRSVRSGRVASATPRLRRQDGKNFGQLFLDSVDRVEARRARRDQHVVHLHSGDIIACRLESIVEAGVFLSTTAEDNTLVAHADIKAIEFVSKATLPEVSESKRQRLLTLPRLQKSSPPTHLLCSSDGDLLRCRLIRADEQNIVVEVQFEEIEIPRERVTHVIWLHPDDAESVDATDNRYEGRVQVLWRDGKRLTFVPTGSSDVSVRGTSDILGSCTAELEKVRQIALGNQISQEAAQSVYSSWKLSPATLPLIMQGTAGSDSSLGDSSLLGNQAPEFLLERLDGGAFKLSEHRGQVVIIDFWASWCAPCMKTMPLLTRAVADFDPTRVLLVGVNVEERREVVRDTIDRLGIQMVVALDSDGSVSKDYEATRHSTDGDR